MNTTHARSTAVPRAQAAIPGRQQGRLAEATPVDLVGRVDLAGRVRLVGRVGLVGSR